MAFGFIKKVFSFGKKEVVEEKIDEQAPLLPINWDSLEALRSDAPAVAVATPSPVENRAEPPAEAQPVEPPVQPKPISEPVHPTEPALAQTPEPQPKPAPEEPAPVEPAPFPLPLNLLLHQCPKYRPQFLPLRSLRGRLWKFRFRRPSQRRSRSRPPHRKSRKNRRQFLPLRSLRSRLWKFRFRRLSRRSSRDRPSHRKSRKDPRRLPRRWRFRLRPWSLSQRQRMRHWTSRAGLKCRRNQSFLPPRRCRLCGSRRRSNHIPSGARLRRNRPLCLPLRRLHLLSRKALRRGRKRPTRNPPLLRLPTSPPRRHEKGRSAALTPPSRRLCGGRKRSRPRRIGSLPQHHSPFPAKSPSPRLSKKRPKPEKTPGASAEDVLVPAAATGPVPDLDAAVVQIASVFTKSKLDDDTLQDLEDLLIRADLGIETAIRVTDRWPPALRQGRYRGRSSSRSWRRKSKRCWRPVAKPLELDLSHKPHVILVVGVNGTGKTTTIGKLAAKLARAGSR